LVAAGFALLLTFVWVIGDQDKVQSNTLAETEVFDYYLNNIEEVNGELLLDFEALNSFENNISLVEFEEYEIENYLENIVDELSVDDLLIIDELNNDLIE
jgi:Icc-related predicted phosphoesterase